MRRIPLFLLFVVIGGCSARNETVLGIRPMGTAIIAIRDLKPGAPVIVQGTMVEKCPVAGCWFMVRDKSGLIRVDTKNAGFVVSDVPLNVKVKVSGTLKTSGERMIAASGMTY